tara:strand:+ start:73 stop:441 length:369 start_codon:yes stop_codon:yes gene_type:complete
MPDLNIPNLNKKNDKYLFKNKLNQRRKSKKKLLSESFYMFFLSGLLVFINYLIPNKLSLFRSFLDNFEKASLLTINLFSYLFQIFLVIFILISMIFALLLVFGSLYRILKLIKRKTKQISYK